MHFQSLGILWTWFPVFPPRARLAMLALLIPSVSFHFMLLKEMKDEGEISTISSNGWFAIAIRLGIAGVAFGSTPL